MHHQELKQQPRLAAERCLVAWVAVCNNDGRLLRLTRDPVARTHLMVSMKSRSQRLPRATHKGAAAHIAAGRVVVSDKVVATMMMTSLAGAAQRCVTLTTQQEALRLESRRDDEQVVLGTRSRSHTVVGAVPAKIFTTQEKPPSSMHASY